MARRKNAGAPLTCDAVARRLSIAAADLPDLGRSWTVRDVTEAQRDRPEWLRSARTSWATSKAEAERQRKARYDAILARRAGFTYPLVPDEAVEFAREFARANLLHLLCGALDSAAADTYVVDCGYDVSTYACRANETNRERAKRGVSLSGHDDGLYAEHGGYRGAGTFGDLFDAPTGNTRATFVSGAGLDAERWEHAWHDMWPLEGLALAHVLARLVLRGDTDILEVIAGVPLTDVETDAWLVFDGVSTDVLSLARQAHYEWSEREFLILDPEDIIDMDAPLSALPRLLLATRHDWDQTEQLAAVIAGVEPVGRR